MEKLDMLITNITDFTWFNIYPRNNNNYKKLKSGKWKVLKSNQDDEWTNFITLHIELYFDVVFIAEKSGSHFGRRFVFVADRTCR